MMFIEMSKNTFNKIIKKNTFLFFKPNGSRLANQTIVGIYFERTIKNVYQT